ncbi:MAG: long-chain fatty acid--CoA ligase [Bacteroidetes bacterium HGW-Bacteroidetes-1]|jgi:long-chain acyl-CoA synthetase|nr:MAG: long-chain fatty acid--CoA ligase [Bacteroidetes bacterium HGW-Bacteroidetes-1]
MLKNLGNKTAICYGKETTSYQQLLSRIRYFAGLFFIEQGNHAVVFSENKPGYIYAFYSIWKHQGIAIPVDFMATAGEVAYILGDCKPEIVFTSSKCLPVMQEAISLSGIKTSLLIIDEHEASAATFEEEGTMPDPVMENTAVIIYTSGTTGSPKGVMLSFQNLIQNIKAVSIHIPIYRNDSRVLVLLPLHHIFPLMGTMIIPLQIGAMIAISPSMVSEDIMKTLQQNKITIIIGVPRLYAAIRKGIMDKVNKSPVAKLLFKTARMINSPAFSRKVFGTVHNKLGGAVESLVSGGAALDVEVGKDFQTLGFEVLEGYGMTEAAPMITFTRPGRVRIGSPGEAMQGTDIRIVDGEITAAGDNIMQGYYNRPEETAEVLKDGWLYTGDLGYIDKEGYLFITGRKKEIIILSNGKNVNPAELEEVLLASPFVKDCGVFFQNDQLQVMIQTEPTSFEKHENPDKDAFIRTELIENFNKSVSGYKKIMRFYLTENDLPRTRLGKLQRFKLADLIDEKPAHEEPVSEITDPVFLMIAEYLEKEKGRKVKSFHHLEIDLGLDSLDKVSFQAYLQQTFGVSPEPPEMANFKSILALSAWISENKTQMEDIQVNWADILREKVSLKLPATWITGNIAIWVSRIFFNLYFRFKASGHEKIPEGPCILVPNHQSFFDGMFVASYLRFSLARRTYFYAKEKHIRQPFIKFLANRNNIIIMDLNRNLKESIQKMAEVLRNNKNLIIFPEGTRTFNGRLGDFKKTFAILSSELNVPIVPVSIKGAFEALPRGSFFPKPWKKISVEFLDPVYPDQQSYEVLAELVKNKIQMKQA